MILRRRGILNLDGLFNLAFITTTCLHVYLAPYTKVEESFSIQAIHDILAFGVWPESIQKYDHQVFSGAVPRSFIGPLLLSVFSYPILLVTKGAGLLRSSADAALCIRLILALLNSTSILFLSAQYHAGYQGRLCRRAFIAVCIAQFQTLFWAGRTTPNGLVSPLVNVALALVLSVKGEKQSRRPFIGLALLTACAVIARIELVGILIPAVLCIFFSRPDVETLHDIVRTGLSSAIFSLMITLLIDTYFWSRSFSLWNPLRHTSSTPRGLLWPELEAVLFNVIDGKSADWGTSAWHAYLSTHVPKMLSFTSPLTVLGMALEVATPSPRYTIIIVIVVHTAIMSLLGHKETRFVLYLAPLFNLLSARAVVFLWQRRRFRYLARACIFLCLSATALTTAVSLRASVGNYPGGEAMQYLHRQKQYVQNATVHIDVLPAMTGVNLFQSIHLPRPAYALGISAFPSVLFSNKRDHQWRYDKTEDLDVSDIASYQQFNYILSEKSNCHIPALFSKIPEGTFAEFASVSIKRPVQWLSALRGDPSTCLSQGIISWRCFDFLIPLHFKWRDAVWLCERKQT